jgi:hypothetical protein
MIALVKYGMESKRMELLNPAMKKTIRKTVGWW